MERNYLVRIFDFVLCIIIGLALLVPILILIIVKLLADGRPLFFMSKRVGKNAQPFTVFKFRTMVNNRAFIENYLKSIKSHGFERIPINAEVYTKVGRIYERFQIVEVPQIFNVMAGKMSLVGNRPLPMSHIKELEAEVGAEKVAIRHIILPGITGISQIMGKANLTNTERIDIENGYVLFVKNSSQLSVIYYNVLIITETLCVILFRKSIFLKTIKKKLFKHGDYQTK